MNTIAKKIVYQGTVVCILTWGGLFMISGADAEWQFLDGALNTNTAYSAKVPSIAIGPGPAGDVPYVAIQEYEGISYLVNMIFVKRWNGSAWEWITAMPGYVAPLNRHVSHNAINPSLAITQDTSFSPYVAWEEDNGLGNHQIYVSFWKGSEWEEMKESLNMSIAMMAQEPSIAVTKEAPSIPYVVWREHKNEANAEQIYVKRWNSGGAYWELLPGTGPDQCLNRSNTTNAFNPCIGIINNTPYVAWVEGDPPNTDINIYVSYWDESGTPAWEPLGRGLKNGAQLAAHPSIVLDNQGVPYVAWQEEDGGGTNVFVKYWDDDMLPGHWEPVGAKVNDNQPAAKPGLSFNTAGTLYIIWEEEGASHRLIKAKYFATSIWIPLGGALNKLPENAASPAIASLGSGPFVAWQENNPMATPDTKVVFVKQWIEPTPTPSPTASFTSTPLPYLSPPSTSTPNINSIVEADEVQAYPIPASDRVNFAFKSLDTSGEVKIRVYNTNYRLVTELTGQAPGGEGVITWDVSGIAPGIYLYQVRIGDKKLSMKKLVIAR